MSALKYLSNQSIATLKLNLRENLKRYRDGDFIDFTKDGDWGIELPITIDTSLLASLEPGNSSEVQIRNSLLVWRALSTLSPSLACEEGIWVRLTHVECLAFSRARWLRSGMSDEELSKSVEKHFFASTRTQWRDDNAVSRLWWNAYIAHQLNANGAQDALPFLLRLADTRSNIVERALTGVRIPLVNGMVRLSTTQPWFISSEGVFREFMITLNKMGGGIVFEAMSSDEIDSFLLKCALQAGMPI